MVDRLHCWVPSKKHELCHGPGQACITVHGPRLLTSTHAPQAHRLHAPHSFLSGLTLLHHVWGEG